MLEVGNSNNNYINRNTKESEVVTSTPFDTSVQGSVAYCDVLAYTARGWHQRIDYAYFSHSRRTTLASDTTLNTLGSATASHDNRA